MKVELAKSAGFCFGVEKAVNTVYEEAKKENEIVYTLGPIIHNEEVVKDMKKRGVEAVKKGHGDYPFTWSQQRGIQFCKTKRT